MFAEYRAATVLAQVDPGGLQKIAARVVTFFTLWYYISKEASEAERISMSVPMIKQLPITVRGAHKTDVRSQFAALCYRVQNGKVQVLLITSRGTGRWIIPKGWPIDGLTPSQSAGQEAWEEAGVVGKALDVCLGLFSYRKFIEDDDPLSCIAMVYPLKVKRLETNFPEAGQRKVKWVSRKKAAQMVAEPELARILRDFDPRHFV